MTVGDIGRNASRVQIAAERGGVDDRVAEPDRGAEVCRLGAPGQQGFGADVEGHPVDLGEAHLPPTRSEPSSTTTSTPA